MRDGENDLTPPEERREVRHDLIGYGSTLEIVKGRRTVRLDGIGASTRAPRAEARRTATDFPSRAGKRPAPRAS